MHKKVLIIAYWFPPLGGVGVQRTLRFLRNLPQFGWECHVLTVREGVGESPVDRTLFSGVPHETRVWRTPFWDIRLIPNSFNHRGLGPVWRWIKRAVSSRFFKCSANVPKRFL